VRTSGCSILSWYFISVSGWMHREDKFNCTTDTPRPKWEKGECARNMRLKPWLHLVRFDKCDESRNQGIRGCSKDGSAMVTCTAQTQVANLSRKVSNSWIPALVASLDSSGSYAASPRLMMSCCKARAALWSIGAMSPCWRPRAAAFVKCSGVQ
jgi:hypothetical protein